jgi:hypothetical protein
MKAHREGKSWVARVEDCEAFWQSRQRRQPAPVVPSSDEARWAKAGLRVVGGAK